MRKILSFLFFLMVSTFAAASPVDNAQLGAFIKNYVELVHKNYAASYDAAVQLQQAVDGYYQAGKHHVVSFLEKFGYMWKDGVIHALPQTG